MFPFLGTFPKSVAYRAHRRNLHIEFSRAHARLTARKDKGVLRMKKLIALILTLTVVAATISAKPSKKEQQMKQNQIVDRMELRELVDRYAVESDKGNQDYYRNIFSQNLRLRIIIGENVNEINGVEKMIEIYKKGGAAKISFHQTGQQVLDFIDESHAKGVVYLTALFGDEKPAKMYIRYEDTYEKIDGRWWITARDQIFVHREQ